MSGDSIRWLAMAETGLTSFPKGYKTPTKITTTSLKSVGGGDGNFL